MKVLCLILLVYCVFVVTIKQGGNFGKFDLRVKAFENCKGPKRKDCGHLVAEMLNDTVVTYTLDLKRATTITKGKIVAIANNTEFLRLQMKDPCDHLFLQPILQSTLNISPKCTVKSGKYEVVVDIEQTAMKYYAGTFLYGTFAFKTLFLADDCNFSCTNVIVDFLPKSS